MNEMNVQERMEYDLGVLATNSIRIADALERLVDKFAPVPEEERWSM